MSSLQPVWSPTAHRSVLQPVCLPCTLVCAPYSPYVLLTALCVLPVALCVGYTAGECSIQPPLCTYSHCLLPKPCVCFLQPVCVCSLHPVFRTPCVCVPCTVCVFPTTCVCSVHPVSAHTALCVVCTAAGILPTPCVWFVHLVCAPYSPLCSFCSPLCSPYSRCVFPTTMCSPYRLCEHPTPHFSPYFSFVLLTALCVLPTASMLSAQPVCAPHSLCALSATFVHAARGSACAPCNPLLASTIHEFLPTAHEFLPTAAVPVPYSLCCSLEHCVMPTAHVWSTQLVLLPTAPISSYSPSVVLAAPCLLPAAHSCSLQPVSLHGPCASCNHCALPAHPCVLLSS